MGLREIQRIHEEANLPKEKKYYKIPRVSKKRQDKLKKEKEENTTDIGEDKFFDYHMKHSKPICEECGMQAWWLLEPQEDKEKEKAYKLIWRACHAHLLPKKKRYGFPSLRNKLDNHAVLFPSWGGLLCGCHGFYDSNWYNASTMKIWDKAKEIFRTKLYPLIPEKERKNIPDVLIQELPKIDVL